MRRFVTIVAGVALFVVSVASGASDIFLKLDGVPGDSTDPQHQGWFVLQGFSWGHGAQLAASCTTAQNYFEFAPRRSVASSRLTTLVGGRTPVPSATVDIRGQQTRLTNVVISSWSSPTNMILVGMFQACTQEATAGRFSTARPMLVLAPQNASLVLGTSPAELPLSIGELRFTGPHSAIIAVKPGSAGFELLRQASASARPVSKAKVKKNEPYLVVTLDNVLVSSYRMAGGDRAGGRTGYEEFSLNFTKVEGRAAGFRDPAYTGQ